MKDFKYGEYIDCNLSNKVDRYTPRMCIGLYYISCGVKQLTKKVFNLDLELCLVVNMRKEGASA